MIQEPPLSMCTAPTQGVIIHEAPIDAGRLSRDFADAKGSDRDAVADMERVATGNLGANALGQGDMRRGTFRNTTHTTCYLASLLQCLNSSAV